MNNCLLSIGRVGQAYSGRIYTYYYPMDSGNNGGAEIFIEHIIALEQKIDVKRFESGSPDSWERSPYVTEIITTSNTRFTVEGGNNDILRLIHAARQS